ncbi:MAG TPA: hypothetical protein EYP90_07420, partial [Chromatiaceae bacterium]|nr:hypothetical protein [Chromatiaceae bacterium]
VIKLLDEIGEVYEGRNAVIVGASNIVGRPMMLEYSTYSVISPEG